jgi:hypothetical protein
MLNNTTVTVSFRECKIYIFLLYCAKVNSNRSKEKAWITNSNKDTDLILSSILNPLEEEMASVGEGGIL